MKNAPVKISAVVLMMTCAFAHPAPAQTVAATKSPSTSQGAPNTREKAKNMGDFSQAGHAAMMNIGDARLAIFDGDPTVALKLMESAKRLLAQADKDMAPTANGSTTHGSVSPLDSPMRSVPVDGQLALVDDFVMSPEKRAHIDKANESFKKGDHATGLEELRLGAIDVNYTRWWLPIEPTETHLDQAIKLAGENKYYEASLALKAIEDSVTMDSISFSDLPATGRRAQKAS